MAIKHAIAKMAIVSACLTMKLSRVTAIAPKERLGSAPPGGLVQSRRRAQTEESSV